MPIMNPSDSPQGNPDSLQQQQMVAIGNPPQGHNMEMMNQRNDLLSRTQSLRFQSPNQANVNQYPNNQNLYSSHAANP
jgi:hypothetical protein